MKTINEQNLLPPYPRIAHLAIEPNGANDDLIAPELFTKDYIECDLTVEEKLDGASVAMTWIDGRLVVRNSTHILNKAYAKTKTPAKAQFVPIWTWGQQNKKRFETLASDLGYMPSVYGEWLFARHTVAYNSLPDLFVAYDIYCPMTWAWSPAEETRRALLTAGLCVPPLLGIGPKTCDELRALRDGASAYSTTEKREGIVLRTQVGGTPTRYKMVRPGFRQADGWVKAGIVKNIVGSR